MQSKHIMIVNNMRCHCSNDRACLLCFSNVYTVLPYSASGWESGWTRQKNWNGSSSFPSWLSSSTPCVSLWGHPGRTGPSRSQMGLRNLAPCGSLSGPSPPSTILSTYWCQPTWTRERKAWIYASLAYLREIPSNPFTVFSAAQATYQGKQLQQQFYSTQTTLVFPSSLQMSCVRFLKTASRHMSVSWLSQTVWWYSTRLVFLLETRRPMRRRRTSCSLTSLSASPTCLETTTMCFSLHRPWRCTGQHSNNTTNHNVQNELNHLFSTLYTCYLLQHLWIASHDTWVSVTTSFLLVYICV